jgi:hypothetical protein
MLRYLVLGLPYIKMLCHSARSFALHNGMLCCFFLGLAYMPNAILFGFGFALHTVGYVNWF